MTQGWLPQTSGRREAAAVEAAWEGVYIQRADGKEDGKEVRTILGKTGGLGAELS